MEGDRAMSSLLGRLFVAVLFGLVASGCASGTRSSQGVDWIVANEAEKARLQAAGFPQYNHD
jgi:hypothetical protein